MLYLKLQTHLPNERAAVAAMQSFAPFSAVVSCWRAQRENGSELLRYAVLVPAGRRLESLRKQLLLQAPHSNWTLVDMDADGVQTPVVPETPA